MKGTTAFTCALVITACFWSLYYCTPAAAETQPYCAPPMSFQNWFVGDPQPTDGDRAWNGATGTSAGIVQGDFAYQAASTECREVTPTGNDEKDEDND